MNPQDTSMHDRETLSALFDGELGGEARLFAMRRLAHDADWQRATGRWQLIGDAMRSQAPIAAPADFADRVRAAVVVSPASAAAPAVPTTSVPRAPTRRVHRWVGGALAASVALAAVIGLRPDGPGRGPAGTEAMTAAVATASAPAVALQQSPAEVASTVAPAADAVRSPSAAPTRALAPRAAERRVAVERRPRVVPAASRSDAGDAEAPLASTAVLVADDENPFRLRAADSIDARPWPRAALTGASAGAFTARYGSGSQSAPDAPSFYPFEPRLESGADTSASPTP